MNKLDEIKAIAQDIWTNVGYYDRKESDVGVYDIEDAIIDGLLTEEEFVAPLISQLKQSVAERRKERSIP